MEQILVTIHLREDRRHIKDAGCSLKIKKIKGIILINLRDLQLNNEMLKIALMNKPNFVCIVPENRKEITTEGGLNLLEKIIIKYLLS